jgi:YHS domain-containing protein
MFRLLFLIILGYLFYRAIKSAFGKTKGIKKGPDGAVIDEMVQDPFCKTYVPLREAVKKTLGGQVYFFCSKECADKFEPGDR